MLTGIHYYIVKTLGVEMHKIDFKKDKLPFKDNSIELIYF